MPKRTLYTCDRCGKEYFEPELFTDEPIGEFSYDVSTINKDGNRKKYIIGKDTASYSVYLCSECTKEFNKLLKNYGFKRLQSSSIFDKTPMEL